MIVDVTQNLIFFLRWIHIFAGIIWIGHLYFFNFVNVPFQGVLPKEMKSQVNPALLLRALFWFRWGAMITFIVGILLFFVKYGADDWALLRNPEGGITDRTMWILFGMLLGTIMWFNVWFIIWPAQKRILGWVKAGQAPPEMPALAKRALLASRTNTFLSGPMLFAMIAPNNYGTMGAPILLITVATSLAIIWALIKFSPKAGATI